MMRRRCLLIGGGAAGLRVRRSWAQASSEGFRVMAREKSLAQQFMDLLNQFGPSDRAQYARGVVLYAGAKAEFDGLISELEHGLTQPDPPDKAAAFQTALNQAIEKRAKFTDFVSTTILPQSSGTTKGVGGFIQVVPELITALTNAGVSIWREFHAAGQDRRKAIREELEALRWPDFRSNSGDTR